MLPSYRSLRRPVPSLQGRKTISLAATLTPLSSEKYGRQKTDLGERRGEVRGGRGRSGLHQEVTNFFDVSFDIEREFF